MNRQRNTEGIVFFIGFAATIVLANYFIKNIGTVCTDSGVCLIPIWPSFGIGDGMAPSGVLWAGVALTMRDLVQRRLGFWWSWGAVAVGAGLSAFLDPALALASGGAFFVAETLDLFVYTPLQSRNLFGAVIASNVAGAVIDSFVFLALAGLPLIYAEGQIVGKLWMTLLALPMIYMIRNWDDRRGMVPA
jgi:queuosine precursor transporter